MMSTVSAASLSGALAMVCALLSPEQAVLAMGTGVAAAGAIWGIVRLQRRLDAATHAVVAHERRAAVQAHEQQAARAAREQQAAAEAREQAREQEARLQRWMHAVYGSVKQLLEVRLPAAWAGQEVPEAVWPEESVRELLEELSRQAVHVAQEVHDRWERDAESVRLAVVAVAQRAQTAAHRVAAAADQWAEVERDPEARERLMQISHAAAQQARHAQSLQVLCGERTGQQWQHPLALVDVVRAASGRITAYRRIEVTGNPDLAVEAQSVEALVHTVAELLANAAQSSPPATRVMVHVQEAQHGAVIRVDDSGVGLTERELAELRPIASGEQPVRLWQVGEVPRIGLAVVGTLARRLGLQVGMQSSPYGGIQVIVLVPQRLVSALPSGSVPAAAPAPEAPATTASGLPVRGRRRRQDPDVAVAELPAAPVHLPDPETAGDLLADLLPSTETPTQKEDR